MLFGARAPPRHRPKTNALRREDRVLSICRPGKYWHPLLIRYQECYITNHRRCHHVTPRFLRIMCREKRVDGVDRSERALDGCIRLHLLSAERTIAEFHRSARQRTR